MTLHRTPLGRRIGPFKSTLNAIDGGLEQDTRNLLEVVKTRVFHDDVVMVSLHRRVSGIAVVMHSLVAVAILCVAGLTGLLAESWLAAAIVAAFAVPTLAWMALHVVVKVDTVTVTGRRSRVSADYLLRKRRARQVHDDIIARVRRVRGAT